MAAWRGEGMVPGERGAGMPVIPAVGHSRQRGFGLDRSSLSLVQRLLLTTDGTVTDILEAYAGEPVEAVKIAQWFAPGDPHDHVLETTADETVLWRRVLLSGRRSRRPFVYGESAMLFDRLDAALTDRLVLTDVPIGKLLVNHRMETLRELVGFGEERAGNRSFYFGIDPSEPMLFRRYRVVSGGRPLMAITESFPAKVFPPPCGPNGQEPG